LELVELAPEVCHRRIRSVVNPRPKHWRDEHRCPNSCDDEKDKFCHKCVEEACERFVGVNALFKF
jgi:hypothetical protein